MSAGVTDTGAVRVPTSVNAAPSSVGSAAVICVGFGAGASPTADDGITYRPELPPVAAGLAEKGIQNPAPHAMELPDAKMMARARMRHRFFMFGPVPARLPKFALRG